MYILRLMCHVPSFCFGRCGKRSAEFDGLGFDWTGVTTSTLVPMAEGRTLNSLEEVKKEDMLR